MASAYSMVGFLLVMAVVAAMGPQTSMAVVYKVGDDKGWTNLGSPNYTEWSANKVFHVGDTILFTYSNQFHNVMQVNHTNFRTCNVTGAYKTYTTGNDSIPITKYGHFFFICGVPGHCQSGQKVDIRVIRPDQSSPVSSPPGSAPGSSPAADGGGSSPTRAPTGDMAGAPTGDMAGGPMGSAGSAGSGKGPSKNTAAPSLTYKGFVGMVVLAMGIFAALLA